MILTDIMIEQALQDSHYVTENPWVMLLVYGLAVVIFSIVFFKSKNVRRKIGAVLMIVLFVYMGVSEFSENHKVKTAIENGEWFVATDTVDRVMVETKNGNTSYFMVLEEYGRVSLNSYDEAVQYDAGKTVYVVVVPYGEGYKNTGIVYNTFDHVYAGNHEKTN